MSGVPANTLYRGHVMHMRLIPRRHQFRYRVFSLLVDIDRMDALSDNRVLKHNRFGLLSLMDRDHGARDGSPLRPWVDKTLRAAGLPECPSVMLLSFPRMLGYAFNPLSVYYCYDQEDALAAVIYEVKNTFGDQVAYALPVGASTGGSYRQRHGKEMFVSPFIDMDQTYRFTMRNPDENLSLRIRQAGPEGETLIATHTGRGEVLTDKALLKAFFSYPLMTLRVISLIHWQALRLFLKGVRFHRYSQSNPPVDAAINPR